MELKYFIVYRRTMLKQPGENNAATISYTVEDNMFKTEVTNENNQTQATFTDVRGRTRKTIQNDELTTQFFYNTVNEQIKVRDHSGNETHYFYDMAGRRTKEEHPDRGTTQYTYDNAGRLIGKETANALEQGANHAITYKYDFGRLMEINYPDHPQNNVSYEYGRQSISPIGQTNNNLGRITAQKDATGVQYFNYGKLGELIQQKRGVAVAGKTFYWFETNWEYDSWARIKKITYPDDEEVSYHYDPAGQLQAITTNLNSLVNVSAPEYIVKNITYTDYGERASITYGNGTTNTYTYDARRRLNTLQHDFANFNMTRKYEYDPLSNITGISSIGATSPTLGALGGPVEHFYKYDPYNRLIIAEGHYTGPDDEVPDMLRQTYYLEMDYDLSHNILQKNQVHQFGSVSSINEYLPAEARHATATSYKLEYSGYGSDTFAHRQPHAPRKITEYPQEDFEDDPNDPRIKRKHIAYDANGNQLEIQEEEKEPLNRQGYRLRSVRKNLWDAEDRLTAVDLEPEADADKPMVAVYTYDAGGERTIKYVSARIDARYSAKDVGNADRFESILYPNALVTARTITFPEINNQEKDPRIMTYTKHYYIGSERIASVLGTKRGMGAYCATERAAVRDELNDKVTAAGQAIEDVFHYFEKDIQLSSPFVYSDSNGYPCSSTQVPEDYGAYWYHPDHLGSSSYITNLDGEISQHMEYLPFGETLVEEHLNSNNSPYKFNAKEFDAETGNYYYGARYYSPRYNLMLSVDPALAMYPGISPYIFVLNNPVRYVDPTGMFVEPPTKSGSYEGQTHYDPDTGATYEWDGQGNWHSDMGGIQELDDVVITGNGSSSPDYVSSSIIAIGAYNNFKEYTQYNEYLEIWKGKNGKMYEGLKGRGPNQYTGSRGFAKSKAANFGKVGNVLSILSIGQTELEFQYNMNNNPGPNLKKYLKDKRLRDQSFNGVGFLGQFGAAASFGYNLGYLIESICNCNIQLNPFTLDFTPIEQTLTEFDNIGIYLYTD